MKKSILAALVISSIAATHAFAFDFGSLLDAVSGEPTVDEVKDQADLALFMYTKSITRENEYFNCNKVDGGNIYELTKGVAKLYPQIKEDKSNILALRTANKETFAKFTDAFPEKYSFLLSKLNDNKLSKKDLEVVLSYKYFVLGSGSTFKNTSANPPYTEDQFKKIYPFIVEAAYTTGFSTAGRGGFHKANLNKETEFPLAISPNINAKPVNGGQLATDDAGKRVGPSTSLYYKNILHKAYYFTVSDLKAINEDLELATQNATATNLRATLTKVLDCDLKPDTNACYAESVFALDAIKADPNFADQKKLFDAEFQKIYEFGIKAKNEKRARKVHDWETMCASQQSLMFFSQDNIVKTAVFPAISAEVE